MTYFNRQKHVIKAFLTYMLEKLKKYLKSNSFSIICENSHLTDFNFI